MGGVVGFDDCFDFVVVWFCWCDCQYVVDVQIVVVVQFVQVQYLYLCLVYYCWIFFVVVVYELYGIIFGKGSFVEFEQVYVFFFDVGVGQNVMGWVYVGGFLGWMRWVGYVVVVYICGNIRVLGFSFLWCLVWLERINSLFVFLVMYKLQFEGLGLQN